MKRALGVRVSRARDCAGSAPQPVWPMRGRVAGLGLAAVLLFLLQAPACSSSSSTGDGGSNPPAQVCLPLDAGLPVVAAWQGVDAGPEGEPLDEFLDDYYAAYCDAESRCVPFASYLIATCLSQLHNVGTWNAYPQCRQSAFGLECVSQGDYDLTVVAQQVAAAETGETLSYDPHAAAACLAVPWSCVYGGPDILFPLACDAAFVGLVPDGGACDFSSECQEGNCVPASGVSCAGTCGAPNSPAPPVPQPGSFCGFGLGCGTDSGLFCDSDYLQCRGDAAVGEPCDDFGFYRCAKGLFCDSTQTCQPQAALGESCLSPLEEFPFIGPDLTHRCATGLVCQGEGVLTDGGVRAGACQPLSQLGEACADLAADELEHLSGCVAGTACSCGVCVPPPSSGKCADEATACLPYVAACDYAVSGMCLPLSSFSRCMNGQQCATGYCTDSETCDTVPPYPACSD